MRTRASPSVASSGVANPGGLRIRTPPTCTEASRPSSNLSAPSSATCRPSAALARVASASRQREASIDTPNTAAQTIAMTRAASGRPIRARSTATMRRRTLMSLRRSRRWHTLTQFQHAQQPEDGRCCQQMLQGMAAHDPAGGCEDCAIELLCDLGQRVQDKGTGKILATRVTRREQRDDEQDEERRPKLHRPVGVEVFDAVRRAPAPVPHARRPEETERYEQPLPGFRADALAYRSGNDAHESDG